MGKIDYQDYDEYGDEIETRHRKIQKVSKSVKSKKSSHKHEYKKCNIIYVISDRLECCTQTEYCTVCGKIKVNDMIKNWQHGGIDSEYLCKDYDVFEITDPFQKNI